MISISTDTSDWNGVSLMWRTKANHHARLDNWFYRETNIILRSDCLFTKQPKWRELDSADAYISNDQLRKNL